MYFGNDSWGAAFIVLGLICGVVGWGVIEFILWIFSFIHISFGG